MEADTHEITKKENYLHAELTSRIIEVFYKVYNKLGYGFLEKVYENAMMIELNNTGVNSVSQYPVKVVYEGHPIGDYVADIVVDNKVILELKASEQLVKENEYQLINYLRATDIEVGLLLNFGKKPEFKRKIFSNSLKKL